MKFERFYKWWIYRLFPEQGLLDWADVKLKSIEEGNWTHDLPATHSPTGSLLTFHEQTQYFGPRFKWAGENLGKGPATSYEEAKKWGTRQGIYKRWENSPSHKAVLDVNNITKESLRINQKDGIFYSVFLRAKW